MYRLKSESKVISLSERLTHRS